MNKGFAEYGMLIGNVRIGYENEKITNICLTEGNKDAGEPTPLTDKVYVQLGEYLAGKRKSFDFPCEPKGTLFQKRVWEKLAGIPYGETRSYKDIAESIGSPKACRAVGMANNKNPLLIVVPCHRVIGEGGKLVGYACGLDMKQSLLDLESNNR